MNQKINTIHMLILDPSSNEAEQTINILRNSGHAVRAQQITSESELETALEQQRWDLFVVRDGLSEPSAEDCLRIVQHYGRDIPFLMTTSNYSIERSLEVLRLGMQDVVPEDNEEYFKLVVERELRAINDRKTRSEASNILKEIEKRNELLLDSSRDAIAYITDGMHIYANNAYMDLFGYDDPDEISCIPVVDLIDSSQQEDFKKYLKAHAKGEDVGELSFSGVKENQEHFDAIMSVTASQYDGEDCTQVYIKLDKDDDAVLAEKLKELSAKDRVTGLYNQDYLLERIDEVKQKIASSNQIYSLIYLELDKFNQFVEE
ncbi:MAG: PAS domain-containing protein, partial [Enterobacterales bacterium]|nr:PAS domain-containing protein [Enterobacterales bacterium]